MKHLIAVLALLILLTVLFFGCVKETKQVVPECWKISDEMEKSECYYTAVGGDIGNCGKVFNEINITNECVFAVSRKQLNVSGEGIIYIDPREKIGELYDKAVNEKNPTYCKQITEEFPGGGWVMTTRNCYGDLAEYLTFELCSGISGNDEKIVERNYCYFYLSEGNKSYCDNIVEIGKVDISGYPDFTTEGMVDYCKYYKIAFGKKDYMCESLRNTTFKDCCIKCENLSETDRFSCFDTCGID